MRGQQNTFSNHCICQKCRVEGDDEDENYGDEDLDADLEGFIVSGTQSEDVSVEGEEGNSAGGPSPLSQ